MDAAAKPEPAREEEDPPWQKALDFLDMFKLEMLSYLHYRVGEREGSDGGTEYYNRFDVGRGYLTLNVKPVDWFKARITTDVSQDETGDFKVRLKYLYGQFKVPVETAVISEPAIAFGMVHTPWLDYEEHTNWYRAQGTMFVERNKLFNSADLGVTASALLGEKLDEDYQKTVSKEYPGAWGSVAAGVYNGGGYHAIEANNGKAFEGRISVRPAGPYFPNLQLSYFAIVGEGNRAGDWDPPYWRSHHLMAGFEHEYLAATGQLVIGGGNQKGDLAEFTTVTDPDTGEETVTGVADVTDYVGGSGFVEVKLPWILSSLFGRYDYFSREDQDYATHRLIGGYAFHFLKQHKNMLLLDFDYLVVRKEPNPWEAKLTLQIKL